MHPPFYHVDHRIGPDIIHDGDRKPVKRRSLPERLRLTPSTCGWPPVLLHVDPAMDDNALPLPTGIRLQKLPVLHVVPPPRRTLRDVIGRLLIRVGQRMILQNRLG